MSDEEMNSTQPPYDHPQWNDSYSDSNMEVDGPSKAYADDFISPMVENQEQYEKSMKKDGNWKRAMAKARGGDLAILQTLSASAMIIPNSNLRHGVCNALCFHLRKPVPSEFRTSEEIDPTAKLAIVSVYGLLRLLRLYRADDKQLEEMVTTSWRAIMRWLVFFEEPAMLDEAEQSAWLISSMTGLLEVGSEIHLVKTLICSDFEAIRLLITLWSEERSVFADHDGVASRALANCGALSEDVRGKLIEMAVRVNLGVPTVVSTKLYSRILDQSGFSINWRALEGYASAMLFFRAVSKKDWGLVQLPLNVDHECYDFQKMMSQDLVEAFPNSDSPDYRDACSAMTKFISFFLLTVDSSWVPLLVGRLLPGGFLQTLIEMSPFLDHKHLRDLRRLIRNALTKSLPSHVARYSLVNRFKKFYFEMYNKETRDKITASPVAAEWKLFEGYLLERLAYRALFDDNQDIEINRCASPNCGRDDVNNNFRICSACKVVRYCSKECQVTDWKYNGHKQRCKKEGSSPENEKEEEKDDGFLLYCVRRDVIRHLPGLRALAVSEFPLESRFEHVRVLEEESDDDDSEAPDDDSKASDDDSKVSGDDSKVFGNDSKVSGNDSKVSDEKAEPSYARYPMNDLNGIGVGIKYTKLPIQFEVFRLQSLLSQVATHEPDTAKRLTRLISNSEDVERRRRRKKRVEGEEEGQSVLVRVETLQSADETKITYVEVSLKTADAFTVPEEEGPTNHAFKRPAGLSRKHQPVEFVSFDKADLYIKDVLEPELTAKLDN